MQYIDWPDHGKPPSLACQLAPTHISTSNKEKVGPRVDLAGVSKGLAPIVRGSCS